MLSKPRRIWIFYLAITVSLELVNHSRVRIIQCTKEKRDLGLLEKNPSSSVCMTAWKRNKQVIMTL